MQPAPTPFLDGLTFPECPRWHKDRLWFSDVFGRAVLSVDAGGRIDARIPVPARPSGLGFLPDGRMLIISQEDALLLAWDGQALSKVAELGGHIEGPPNDLVVDANGNAYVSPFGFDLYGGGLPKTANLVLVRADGEVCEVASDLLFPNGMAITKERELIVAETGAGLLTAFSIGEDGTLSGRRTFAPLPGEAPDGLCLDREGAVWVASFTGGAFLRVRDGGEVTARVEVGDRHAVACALGGADGRTLFLLSAKSDLRAMEQSQGWVETLHVEVAGAGSP